VAHFSQWLEQTFLTGFPGKVDGLDDGEALGLRPRAKGRIEGLVEDGGLPAASALRGALGREEARGRATLRYGIAECPQGLLGRGSHALILGHAAIAVIAWAGMKKPESRIVAKGSVTTVTRRKWYVAVDERGQPKRAADGHVPLYEDRDGARHGWGMGFVKPRVVGAKLEVKKPRG